MQNINLVSNEVGHSAALTKEKYGHIIEDIIAYALDKTVSAGYIDSKYIARYGIGNLITSANHDGNLIIATQVYTRSYNIVLDLQEKSNLEWSPYPDMINNGEHFVTNILYGLKGKNLLLKLKYLIQKGKIRKLHE